MRRSFCRSFPLSALMLSRNASIRLTTFDRTGSLGRSIFSPFCFFAEKLFERILVLVLKFLGLKITALCADDVQGQIEHIFRHLLIFDILEVV